MPSSMRLAPTRPKTAKSSATSKKVPSLPDDPVAGLFGGTFSSSLLDSMAAGAGAELSVPRVAALGDGGVWGGVRGSSLASGAVRAPGGGMSPEASEAGGAAGSGLVTAAGEAGASIP